jgi:hypothetical protein
MAPSKESSRKDNTINFTLKVKASRKRNGPIEFTMDLNPKSKILKINETYSTREELAEIFERINAALKVIDDRSKPYNDVIEINEEKKKRYRFMPGYEQNFEPTFGKIDNIIFSRNSPSVSSVSYTRSYNGDKKPD